MLFKEVIGQNDLKAKLIGTAQSGRIPHALMFAGPEGAGSLALALAWSQYLHCEAKSESDSCGTCNSCLKHKKHVHPDLHFTFPVYKPEKQKTPPVSNDFIEVWRGSIVRNPYLSYNDWLQDIAAENKQGNITAEECRYIIQQLTIKTYQAQHKIQIIWMAEVLGNSGNILLKILEEPPVDTIFILIVENTELMLNTILSRTQIVKVNPLGDDEITEALRKKFEIDEASAKRLARIADGNYNAALNMALGEDTGHDKLLHRWLGFCYNLKHKSSLSNTQNLYEWIDEVSKIGRENQKLFLKYALFFLRECALVAYTGTSAKLEGDELAFAKRLSEKLDVNQFAKIADLLSLLHYHIERNGNAKILLMSNSMKVASVFANEEVTVGD